MSVNTVTNEELLLLRDLTHSEFEARYQCDRFAASVLVSRFTYLVQHMGTKLRFNAFSPILRDAADFCVTISGPPELGWAVPAVSQTVPLFLGPIPDGVRVVMEEIGRENLYPGDVYIVNDPFRVGTHLNDVCFMKPLFYGSDVVGVLNITAHQMDFGGRTKGGFDYSKTTSYEDGLVLPPMLIYRGGQPVQSTISLIEANTRLMSLIRPDIQTIAGCLDLGEGLLVESITKYGIDAYRGAIRYACDASAEAMAHALEAVPDGIYEAEEILDGDSLSGSPEYVVRVRIHKSGRHAEFDFGGTSCAATGAMNCTWADSKTGVAMALKMLLDPKGPFTSATLRNVDVLVPFGSLFNPAPPACTQGFTQPVDAAIKAIFRALNPVLGENAASPDSWSFIAHTAEGVDDAAQEWFVHALSGCIPGVPWGATRSGDGDARQSQIYANLIVAGIEPSEASMPMVILRREAVPDASGPGYHRGGAAVVADSYWPHDGRHNLFQFHVKGGTGGVHGGHPGRTGGGWLFPPVKDGGVQLLPVSSSGALYADATPLSGVLGPDNHELDPHGEYFTPGPTRPVRSGSVLRLIANGGGGWGDPLTREPERVVRDVRDEYVTIEGAARDYGVVVKGDPINDPEGLHLDSEATTALRAAIRTDRTTD
jgi:N-methylhydantoinase B